jgi:hypothetical protein
MPTYKGRITAITPNPLNPKAPKTASIAVEGVEGLVFAYLNKLFAVGDEVCFDLLAEAQGERWAPILRPFKPEPEPQPKPRPVAVALSRPADRPAPKPILRPLRPRKSPLEELFSSMKRAARKRIKLDSAWRIEYEIKGDFVFFRFMRDAEYWRYANGGGEIIEVRRPKASLEGLRSIFSQAEKDCEEGFFTSFGRRVCELMQE